MGKYRLAGFLALLCGVALGSGWGWAFLALGAAAVATAVLALAGDALKLLLRL